MSKRTMKVLREGELSGRSEHGPTRQRIVESVTVERETKRGERREEPRRQRRRQKRGEDRTERRGQNREERTEQRGEERRE